MTAAAVSAEALSLTPSPTATVTAGDISSSVHDKNQSLQDRPQVTPEDNTPASRGSLEDASTDEPLGRADEMDPRFILPKCPLPPRNELEPVETFVAKAVQEQHNNSKDDSSPLQSYKGIVDAIRFRNDPTMLTLLLIALRTAGNGSTLHLLTSVSAKHARLIHHLVRLNPFDLPSKNAATSNTPSSPIVPTDYALADAHLHLVLALVSANSVFLVPTLTSLWKMLVWQQTQAPAERTQRLHAALATLLRLCPKGRTELFPILLSNAPFRMRPGPELVWYYRQCLQVLCYLPSIQGQVLELLVDKCLEMDVEIKIHDGGEATIDDDDDDDEDIFQLDLEDRNPLPDGVSVNEMADKLDLLMLLLFEYTDTAIKSRTSSPSALYQVFVRVFESSVLITHKSKFVQFVLLHVCGLDECQNQQRLTPQLQLEQQQAPVTMYREFAAKLIDIVVDPYRATVTRQAGACYLASFVSRASFVCKETVCESISALLRWAEAYMESLKSVSMHATDARDQCSMHSLFYTVCQAAFYIMCFRGVDAIQFYRDPTDHDNNEYDADPQHIDIAPARWNVVCGHALQPLRYCLESVRSEFLQIAKIYRLLDTGLLERLEQDDRQLASHQHRKRAVSKITTAATLEKERLSGGVGGLGRGTNPLDSFFPFDPYLLLRSHAFIEPFYIHWPGSVEETLMEENDNDEELDDVSEQTDDDSSASDDDASSDSDDDGTEASVRKGSFVQPMSFASNATSVSSKSSVLPLGTPDANMTKRNQLREVWTESLKRTRAPSIENENGSW